MDETRRPTDINRLEIREDDLGGPEIAAFLREHVDEMKSVSPPESKHALDLEGLKSDDISFWTLWMDSRLVGCAGLKALDNKSGEIKSMRIDAVRRGQRLGEILLMHILNTALQRKYEKLYLETGSMAFFKPARALYEKHGFTRRDCFGSYQPDPNSVFYEYRVNAHQMP